MLQRLGLSASVAATVALVLITIVISYLSIVLGELTAKRLALQRTESVALMLGPFISFVARITRPVIWLLDVSTNVAVRVFGGDPKAGREEVTDEEIRALVSGSTTLSDEERQIVDDVFDAGTAQSARGDAAPHRGRLPARRHAGAQGRTRAHQGAALALSGDRGLRRRHHRLRARPRPAGSGDQQPDRCRCGRSPGRSCRCRTRCRCCGR